MTEGYTPREGERLVRPFVEKHFAFGKPLVEDTEKYRQSWFYQGGGEEAREEWEKLVSGEPKKLYRFMRHCYRSEMHSLDQDPWRWT